MSDPRPKRDNMSIEEATISNMREIAAIVEVLERKGLCTKQDLDGDTIEVLHNTHPERIRLSGIDCPEKGQAFGKRAKQAASELVFGKEVTLQTHGQDKYGRTLGDVFLLYGTHVNHTLVEESWCWWYRMYAPPVTELE